MLNRIWPRAVVAVAFLGLVMQAPVVPAHAEPTAGIEPTPAPAAPAPTDQIDPNASVTLNIHKKEGDPVTDGSHAGLPGVEGVTFNVQKITDIDLTTAAGWSALAGRTPEAPGALGAAMTVTTDANGDATISTGTNADFTVGAYLVTEVQKGGYTVAPPFIMTLPYTQDGVWTYEQDVYPKNQEITPDKQVDDTNATVGTNLKYQINGPVPAGDLTKFVVTDPLQADLALQSDTVEVTASNADGTEPVALDAADYTVNTDNNTLTVTFNQSGLDKLENARKTQPALEVHVAFQARVTSLPADGKITNNATIDIPGGQVSTDATPADPNDPGSNGAQTTFAPLTITKTGSGEGVTNASLNGAEFALYLCDVDNKLLGDPLTVATAADGSATGTGLTTAGGVDGGAQSTANAYGVPATSVSGGQAAPNKYCVLETKAPTGFVQNPQPQPVSYDAAANELTVTVDNQKDSFLGQLPATGAWGLVAVFVLGLALLIRGLIVSRRDDKAQAA